MIDKYVGVRDERERERVEMVEDKVLVELEVKRDLCDGVWR